MTTARNTMLIPNVTKLCAYWMYTTGYDDTYIAKKLSVSVSLIYKYRNCWKLPARATAKNAKYVRWLAANSRNIREVDKPWYDKESLYCDKEFLQKFLGKEIGGA